MTSSPYDGILRYIRHLVGPDAVRNDTDAQLLERYVSRREEAAFDALVRRHASLVWSVCRRVLRAEGDAEDAFQATFLVLARKAASIRKRESLSSWLYGVASRVALEARAKAAQRHTRERQARIMETSSTDHDREETRQVLDEELHQLPEKYRAPLVLCYLEGRSHAEAAEHLGWPKGSMAKRMTAALERLRARLLRRGVSLSVATLSAALAENVASAAAPTALIHGTIQAAMLFAAGSGAAATSAVPLAEGVLHAMFMSKVKTALGVLLAVGVLGAGGGSIVYRAFATAQTETLVAVAAPLPEQADKKTDKKPEVRQMVGTIGFARSLRFGRTRATFKLHNGAQVPLRFGPKDGGKNDAAFHRAYALYRKHAQANTLVITGHFTPLAAAEAEKGISFEDQTAVLDVMDVRAAATPVEKNGLMMTVCAAQDLFPPKETLQCTVILQNVSKKDFTILHDPTKAWTWPSDWEFLFEGAGKDNAWSAYFVAGDRRDRDFPPPLVFKANSSLEIPVQLGKETGFDFRKKNGDKKQIREYLEEGKYQMRVGIQFPAATNNMARYAGQLHDVSMLPPIWVGELTTNPLEIEIGVPKAKVPESEQPPKVALKPSLAVSPDGTTGIAVVGNNVVIQDLVSKQEKMQLRMGFAVTIAAFSGDGKFWACAGPDKVVCLYDTAIGRQIQSFAATTFPIKSLAFAPDGKTLTAGDGDQKSIQWEIASGKVILPRAKPPQ